MYVEWDTEGEGVGPSVWYAKDDDGWVCGGPFRSELEAKAWADGYCAGTLARTERRWWKK